MVSLLRRYQGGQYHELQMKKLINALAAMMICTICSGQLPDKLDEEAEIVNLQTRQIRQFFDRFNYKELIPVPNTTPTQYSTSRDLNIAGLFDWDFIQGNRTIAMQFIREICQKNMVLDYLEQDWYAEAITTGKMAQKSIPIHFILRYIRFPEGGSAWEIVSIFSPELHYSPSGHSGKINAHENELSFMRLPEKVNNSELRKGLFSAEVSTSQTTLMRFLLDQKILTIGNVERVRYHFLQVPGWVWQVNKIRSRSWNGGWRITKLQPVSENGLVEYEKKNLYLH